MDTVNRSRVPNLEATIFIMNPSRFLLLKPMRGYRRVPEVSGKSNQSGVLVSMQIFLVDNRADAGGLTSPISEPYGNWIH